MNSFVISINLNFKQAKKSGLFCLISMHEEEKLIFFKDLYVCECVCPSVSTITQTIFKEIQTHSFEKG